MDAQTLELRWRTTLGRSPGAAEPTAETYRPQLARTVLDATVLEARVLEATVLDPTLPTTKIAEEGLATTVVGPGLQREPASAVGEVPRRHTPVTPALGHFEPGDELARGGMGIVYRARQQSLEREVALKRIIDAGSRDEVEERQARFVAEALVTGQLAHPHIVPVHELGRTEAGELFLAMKLVSGVSWSELLHGRPSAGARDLKAELTRLVAVAHAVAFAHSRGILHRDLKPSNVMLGEFGEVLLMDWGLAAAFGPRATPSAAPHVADLGSPSGTPAYMPPELAEGRGADQGPWTDVYLLGAILHEVLTDRPPHRGATFLAVILAASESAPPEFAASVPAELQRICARALAREPRDRHPSVAAFRDELLAYLEHRESLLISSAAERSLERARAGDPAASPAYSELSEAIAGFRQARTLWGQNEAATAGERRARGALASVALRAGDLALAEAQAAELGPVDGKPILEDVTRARARTTRAARTVRLLRASLAGTVALLVGGLAVGLWAKDAQLRVEHAANVAARLRSIQGRLAELERRKTDIEPALDAHPEEIETLLQNVAFVASELAGQRLEAEALAPAFVEVREALEGARRTSGLAFARTLDEALTRYPRRFANRDPFFAVAYSADGRSIAATGRGDALVFDVATGRPVQVLDDLEGDSIGVAFSPDGTRLAVACRDGATALFEQPRGRFVAWLPHEAQVDSCAFSADGRRVVTASWDGTVRVWDATTGAAVSVRAVGGFVHRALFSRDGRSIVSVAGLGSVLVSDATTGEPRRTLGGLDEPVLDVALSADDREVLGVSKSGALAIWDFATGERKARVEPGGRPALRSCTFSPDGRSFLTLSEDSVLRSWDRASLEDRWQRPQASSRAAYSPDGLEVAVGLEEGVLVRLDAATGAVRATLDVHPPTGDGPSCSAFAVAPGGREAATGARDGVVRIWELEAGKLLASLRGHAGAVRAIAWGPGGAELLTSSEDGTVRLWDRASGRLVRRFEGCRGAQGEGPGALAISLDGRRFAVAHGPTASVHELPSGRLVKTLGDHGRPVELVAFTPEGELVTDAADGFRGYSTSLAPAWKSEIASGGIALFPDGFQLVDIEDAHLQLFDRRRGARPGFVNAGSKPARVAVSPDGRSILALFPDSSFAVWTPGASRRPWSRHGLSGQAIACGFAGDGDVVLAFEAGALEVWRRPANALETASPEKIPPLGAALSRTRLLLGRESKLILRDRATGRTLRELADVPGHMFLGQAFTPDGRGVVAVASDAKGSGSLLLACDDAAIAPVTTLARWSKDLAMAVALSPDGERVFAGFFDGKLRALERRSGQLLWESTAGHARVVWIGPSPDGRLVHAVWKQGVFETRDAATGALVRRVQLRPPEVRGCALSPDGRELLVGYDETARLYDATTGVERIRGGLGGHPGAVDVLAFVGEGELATGAHGPAGGVLRFWDRATGQLLRSLESSDLALVDQLGGVKAALVAVTRRGAILRLDPGLSPDVEALDPELGADPNHVVGRLQRRLECRGSIAPPALDAFPGLVAPDVPLLPAADVSSPELEARRGTELLLAPSEAGAGARAGLAWLRSAATGGSSRAMTRLAWALERGLGARDAAEAKALRVAAAKAGDPLGAGDLPAAAEHGDPLARVLVAARDHDRAALEAAAAQGEPDAFAALAELDPARAPELLARGEALGDPPSIRRRGEWLLTRDPAAALDALERAGKLGDRAAWAVLGRVFSEGTVVAPDAKRAAACRRHAQEDDDD